MAAQQKVSGAPFALRLFVQHVTPESLPRARANTRPLSDFKERPEPGQVASHAQPTQHAVHGNTPLLPATAPVFPEIRPGLIDCHDGGCLIDQRIRPT